MKWKSYLSYLKEWAETHRSENFFGMSPASFDEWEENEGKEKHSHYAKIVISRPEANLYNSLLDLDAEEDGVLKAGYKEDTVLVRETAEFDDGHFADISLCSGQTNFFCDPVLFNSCGSEVCVLDCSDAFDGTYEFEDDGEKYIVVVEVI